MDRMRPRIALHYQPGMTARAVIPVFAKQSRRIGALIDILEHGFGSGTGIHAPGPHRIGIRVDDLPELIRECLDDESEGDPDECMLSLDDIMLPDANNEPAFDTELLSVSEYRKRDVELYIEVNNEGPKATDVVMDLKYLKETSVGVPGFIKAELTKRSRIAGVVLPKGADWKSAGSWRRVF